MSAPGDRLVDVAGIRLSVHVAGSGSPAVVLLSSAGGAHDQWDRLVPLLTTTSVTYGRPGLGGSDPLAAAEAARPTDHDELTTQLHNLLWVADVPPPYVLVNCSIGAYLADRFAVRWPEEVAGLVLLDPTMITPLPIVERSETVDDADGRGVVLSRGGCHHLLVSEPPALSPRSVVVSRANGTIPQRALELYWAPLTMKQADHAWRERQQEWAQRIGAPLVIADTAGHFVHADQPELVVAMIDAVIGAWRRDEPLTLDREHVVTAGGYLVESRDN